MELAGELRSIGICVQPGCNRAHVDKRLFNDARQRTRTLVSKRIRTVRPNKLAYSALVVERNSPRDAPARPKGDCGTSVVVRAFGALLQPSGRMLTDGPRTRRLMPRYDLARRALADLRDIARYTRKIWSRRRLGSIARKRRIRTAFTQGFQLVGRPVARRSRPGFNSPAQRGSPPTLPPVSFDPTAVRASPGRFGDYPMQIVAQHPAQSHREGEREREGIRYQRGNTLAVIVGVASTSKLEQATRETLRTVQRQVRVNGKFCASFGDDRGQNVNRFAHATLSPFLNFHRPCLFATSTATATAGSGASIWTARS